MTELRPVDYVSAASEDSVDKHNVVSLSLLFSVRNCQSVPMLLKEYQIPLPFSVEEVVGLHKAASHSLLFSFVGDTVTCLFVPPLSTPVMLLKVECEFLSSKIGSTKNTEKDTTPIDNFICPRMTLLHQLRHYWLTFPLLSFF